MGDEAILAFTRVLGAAATNIAEAAIALFFAELGPGTIREGPDELARARLAEAATPAFTAVPDVLARLVMDAFERAQRRAERPAPGRARPSPPTGRPRARPRSWLSASSTWWARPPGASR